MAFKYSAGGGGGAASADIRSPSYVIAASDSEHPHAADLTCDGTADEVQINAALNALPTSGGRVVLLDGTFQIADPITIPYNGVTLEGQGHSTYIDADALGNNEHAIVISGKEDVTLKDFVVSNQGGGGLTRHCIFIEDGSSNFHIEHVWIDDSDADGIHVEGTTTYGGRIIDCNILTGDGYGILVDMDAGQVIHRLHIEGCYIQAVGLDGIRFSTPDALYAHITGNSCFGCGGVGIRGHDCDMVVIDGNLCYSNTLSGIVVAECGSPVVEGNICYLNTVHGILFDEILNGLCSNNYCVANNYLPGGTGDGIQIDDESTHCHVEGNFCYANGRYGIAAAAPQADGYHEVIGNYCLSNGYHGIYSNSYQTSIVGNYCHDNSQHEEQTYHGIYCAAEAGVRLIAHNVCGNPEQGGAQEDGIHLDSHNNKALIEGNCCYLQEGSGIYLEEYCDDCMIEDNLLWLNGDYGVEIAAATCDRTIVKDNQFLSNVTGAILDSGTDTATLEIWADVGFPDTTHGGRPVKELPDATDTHAYVTLQIPMDFHELVSCRFVLIAEASGNAIFTVDTNYGKICADQQQDAHTDAIAATLLAMTNDELECFPLDDALDVAALQAGDNIGLDLMRDGDHVGDDLEANVNAVGVRLRYV